jgi:hypothetical protein
MKKLIFLMVISGAISACSSKGASPGSQGHTCGTLQGSYTWNFDPTETLTIAGNCTFTDSVCGYTASYTTPAQDWSTVVTILGTNGTPGCMANGAHMCSLEFNGTQLAVECDGGAVLELYTKQ